MFLFFSKIEILAPLKHPSELATHPSMSHPYTSKTLQRMVENANAKLRQEQEMLHKAKRLHRELLGDAPWMPCGFLETMDDRNIFDPNYGFSSHSSSKHGNAKGKSGQSSRRGSAVNQAVQTKKDFSTSLPNSDLVNYTANGVSPEQRTADDDVEMGNGPGEPPENKDTIEPENTVMDEPTKPNGQAVSPPESINGDNISNRAGDKEQSSKQKINEDPLKTKEEPKDNIPGDPATTTNGDDMDMDKDADGTEDEAAADDNDNDEGASSPEPPRRMTTRARANQAANQPTTPTSSDTARSGTPSSTTNNHDTLTMHPIFLLPPTHLDRTCGLPPTEADEVRRMLWSYIQKQEETVRASLRMYHMLLGACRKKDMVWEWCKAEGHVGELSDGEDWYDREQWGLGEGEDLRKGADEDEVEGLVDEGRGGGAGTGTGKRGRGRRA